MNGQTSLRSVATNAVLVIAILLLMFPLYVAFVASTISVSEIVRQPMPLLPGSLFLENYAEALFSGSDAVSGATPALEMMFNSLVMAIGIAVGKIIISLMSAYALVFFRFPLRTTFFWMIFITLMLPVEVRIVPTFEVVAQLGMLDSYAGLIVPLIASATATFLFRQFFMTIPDQLLEAARIDGAGPIRFFFDVVLPLSVTNIAALFVILFIYGWNQYLWPLLITKDTETIVIGIYRMIEVGEGEADWHLIMATTILAMLPPLAVVILMQRWFVRGLIETEK